MKADSQNNVVLNHMTVNGSITPHDALQYGIMRLASRVNDLRNMGYNINTDMVYTEKSKYAKYSLDIKQ